MSSSTPVTNTSTVTVDWMCRWRWWSSRWWRVVMSLVVVTSSIPQGPIFGVYSLLYPCPDICICLSDTKVLCNGAGLHQIPSGVPQSVEELSFSRNSLNNLSTGMFAPWPHLRTVTLDNNELRTLQPFIFRGMTNIKQISVQNNPLSELTPFSFAGIENVTQINLSNNRIEVIFENVFTGSRNIGMLLLQGNPLVRVKAKAFSGLRTVQFLYLPSWIKVLEADVFFGLHGIGLLKLQSLDLHALRPYTFRGLSNVTQISIQDSDLGVFKRDAFAGLRNVGEIRILNNKVDRLEALVISTDLNVDGVLVQGNHFLQLSGVTPPLLLEANQRNVINGNYFPCSCQLLWVLRAPVTKTDPHFLKHNFCVSPYSLHGSPIVTVPSGSIIPCPETSGRSTSFAPEPPPVTTTTTSSPMGSSSAQDTSLRSAGLDNTGGDAVTAGDSAAATAAAAAVAGEKLMQVVKIALSAALTSSVSIKAVL